MPPEEILRLAASVDQVSGHVLAGAVVRAAAERKCQLLLPGNVTEVAGQGITGTVSGRHVALGRAEWAGVRGEPPWVKKVRRRARLDGVLTVFVAADHEPAGALLLEDRIRPDARSTIRALRRGGIKRIVLATGDRADVAVGVGAITGVDEVFAGLTPAGKLDLVRREQRQASVIMTGDGINDAPALALADVGVAMGRPQRTLIDPPALSALLSPSAPQPLSTASPRPLYAEAPLPRLGVRRGACAYKGAGAVALAVSMDLVGIRHHCYE